MQKEKWSRRGRGGEEIGLLMMLLVHNMLNCGTVVRLVRSSTNAQLDISRTGLYRLQVVINLYFTRLLTRIFIIFH